MAEYIATFDKYSFLWKEDLQAIYDAFMRTNPTLEAFEAELKKYMAIETEIASISTCHNIGRQLLADYCVACHRLFKMHGMLVPCT